MNNTDVFIKNILDSVTETDNLSVVNSISIINLQKESNTKSFQLGGMINDKSSEDYLTTTNEDDYGKKSKKNKPDKSDSLFKTRSITESNKYEDSSDSSVSLDSSSFEDSMDSTSISSDSYPLFNYYGNIKKESKKKSGRSNKSKKNPKKQTGGTRILKNNQ